MSIKNTNITVNGGWSRWGAFTKCDKTCGAGIKVRERQCNNPKPRNGGNYCPGGKIIETELDIEANGKWKMDKQGCWIKKCRK